MPAASVRARHAVATSMRRAAFEDHVLASLWFVPVCFVVAAILLSRVSVVIDHAQHFDRQPGVNLPSDAATMISIEPAMMRRPRKILTGVHGSTPEACRRPNRASRSGVSTRMKAGSKKVDAAEKFIAWATSKDYTKLVASRDGWANVPPGTRTSLYKNPEYLKVAPFAKPTLDSIDAADPNKPTVKPVPYVGVQYAAIP